MDCYRKVESCSKLFPLFIYKQVSKNNKVFCKKSKTDCYARPELIFESTTRLSLSILELECC